MGHLGVQQFNVKFNSLSYRVKGLVKPVLMDCYQRALSDRVCHQAMGRPDWGACRSTRELQAVALLALKQLEDLHAAAQPPLQPGHPPLPSSMVPVP